MGYIFVALYTFAVKLPGYNSFQFSITSGLSAIFLDGKHYFSIARRCICH